MVVALLPRERYLIQVTPLLPVSYLIEARQLPIQASNCTTTKISLESDYFSYFSLIRVVPISSFINPAGDAPQLY